MVGLISALGSIVTLVSIYFIVINIFGSTNPDATFVLVCVLAALNGLVAIAVAEILGEVRKKK